MHHQILQNDIDGEVYQQKGGLFNCGETHKDSRSSVKQPRGPSLY